MQILKKGSKLYSILTGTCPRCMNESMYVQQNPYHLPTVLKMQHKCSHCHLKYQLEPSFFYGAMYVSYALNVGIAIATFVVSYLMLQTSITNSFIAIIAILVLLYPPVLRWSRNIYINMFVSYQPQNKP